MNIPIPAMTGARRRAVIPTTRTAPRPAAPRPVAAPAPVPAAAPAPAAPAAAPAAPVFNQNAYDLMAQTLASYGLGALAPVVHQYIQQGYGPDTVDLLVQQTPEFKKRFAANQTRIANGQTPLSIPEYLGLERSYRQILSSAGMPAGFYDSNEDFTNWIAGDVSPNEIQARVDEANKFIQNTDQNVRQALQSYHNIGDGELAAYFLDQKKALPVLQRQSQAAQIGAAALDQGLQLTDQNRADLYASKGVTAGQAQQAYGQIAQILPTASKLSDIYGGPAYTQSTGEDEVLGGLASAQRRRQQLADQEVASFAGNGGARPASFGGSTAGAY